MTEQMTETQRKDAAASAFLKRPLSGERIHRKDPPPDVGEWNFSLQTLANHLRNKRLVPVEADMEENHPRATHYVEPEEIRRFYEDREAQKEDQRTALARMRLRKGVADLNRLAGVIRSRPDLAKKSASSLRGAALKLTSELLNITEGK